jgi:hypothetical protein
LVACPELGFMRSLGLVFVIEGREMASIKEEYLKLNPGSAHYSAGLVVVTFLFMASDFFLTGSLWRVFCLFPVIGCMTYLSSRGIRLSSTPRLYCVQMLVVSAYLIAATSFISANFT